MKLIVVNEIVWMTKTNDDDNTMTIIQCFVTSVSCRNYQL